MRVFECALDLDLLRSLDRFLDKDLRARLRSLDGERRLPRDLDRLGRERDRRFDLLERDGDRLRYLERERDRLRDRDRRDRDRLRFLSFDKIPMTGSMAAEIMLCASFTRVIASSISRCAVSLLLAIGLAMACVEW